MNTNDVKNKGTGLKPAILLMIFVLTVLAGFIPIRNKRAEAIIEEKLLLLGADSVSIGHVSIIFWTGINLHDVSIKKSVALKESCFFDIRDVSIHANIFSAGVDLFLRNSLNDLGRKDYFSLILNSPLDAIDEITALMEMVKSVKRIEINDGICNLSLGSADEIRMDGLNLNANKNSSGFDGEFSCKNFSGAYGYEGKNAGADFILNGSKLRIKNGKGEVFEGRLKADGEFDLLQKTLLWAELGFGKIDISKFYDEKEPGKISGSADGKFRFEKSALSIDSLTGRGTMELSDVHLFQLPFQKTLITAFVASSFSDLRFRKIESDIELSSGKLLLNSSGKGKDLSFTANGWVSADMYIEQQVEGVLTEEFASSLPPVMANALERNKDGGRPFKFRVYGPVSEPRLELDRELLRGAVRRGFSEFRRNLRNSLR